MEGTFGSDVLNPRLPIYNSNLITIYHKSTRETMAKLAMKLWQKIQNK